MKIVNRVVAKMNESIEKSKLLMIKKFFKNMLGADATHAEFLIDKKTETVCMDAILGDGSRDEIDSEKLENFIPYKASLELPRMLAKGIHYHQAYIRVSKDLTEVSMDLYKNGQVVWSGENDKEEAEQILN